MKLTKGQKNRINAMRWAQFETDVQRASYRRIEKTFSGPEPSYSFTPGGGGLGFDDPGAVARYLQRTFCPEIDLPKYGKPYTEEEISKL